MQDGGCEIKSGPWCGGTSSHHLGDLWGQRRYLICKAGGSGIHRRTLHASGVRLGLVLGDKLKKHSLSDLSKNTRGGPGSRFGRSGAGIHISISATLLHEARS